MSLPIIISDIDGVVCNIMERCILAIWKDFHVLLSPEDCTQYDMATSFYPHLQSHFPDKESLAAYLMQRVFQRPKELLKAHPYYEALVHYNRFMMAGGVLYLFTSRSVGLAYTTNTWTNKWGLNTLPAQAFHEHTAGKRVYIETYLRCLRAGQQTLRSQVWVIDDCPKALEELQNIPDPNLRVFRMNRPWNRDFACQDEPLKEIAAALEELKAC